MVSFFVSCLRLKSSRTTIKKHCLKKLNLELVPRLPRMHEAQLVINFEICKLKQQIRPISLQYLSPVYNSNLADSNKVICAPHLCTLSNIIYVLKTSTPPFFIRSMVTKHLILWVCSNDHRQIEQSNGNIS